jgi:hypothetical protein
MKYIKIIAMTALFAGVAMQASEPSSSSSESKEITSSSSTDKFAKATGRLARAGKQLQLAMNTVAEEIAKIPAKERNDSWVNKVGNNLFKTHMTLLSLRDELDRLAEEEGK